MINPVKLYYKKHGSTLQTQTSKNLFTIRKEIKCVILPI